MLVRCNYCGKIFNTKPYRIKRIKNSICCSKKCDSNLKKELYKDKNNPNFKYKKNLDFIYDLTHDGCYVLGLIYSDGNIKDNSITIYQKEKDAGYLLHAISIKIFNKDLVKKNSLTINSKNLVNFILSLGGIKIGKKDSMVSIPNIPEDKKWSFICGYFDGDGGFKYNYKYPQISIYSNSKKILNEISKYWNVNYDNNSKKIYAQGYKALDICGYMYENVTFKHEKKYFYFLDILNWEPLPNGRWYKDEMIKYKFLSNKSIKPTKNRVTDTGYDIYAVDIKFNKNTNLYEVDTKLAIEPPPGYYFDVIGRSSLPKSGFIFAGGVGVIDKSYIGSIKMLLYKINDNAKLPKLPFKLAQIIPRKIVHFKLVQVDKLSDTNRGTGGFGSTGI